MTLADEKKEYEEHLEAQEAFENAFDEAGLPDGLRGEMKEVSQGNLTMKIGFNADYDDFYPIVTFWAFGNRIGVFGQSVSERLQYRAENDFNKIYKDEINDAVESAKDLVDKLENSFIKTLSLDQFSEEAIKFRLFMIFMTHGFGELK